MTQNKWIFRLLLLFFFPITVFVFAIILVSCNRLFSFSLFFVKNWPYKYMVLDNLALEESYEDRTGKFVGAKKKKKRLKREEKKVI